ncbi:MgtC/SapB family protein [Ruminococcaceae bacterium OttesenSCG-928-A16]|nr:MgtC/SapB family protein [Ruminococcaceae bacterium OttesenSCG-928-A16]
MASVLLRTGLAVLLGAVLGLERGRKNRPAGFRTYMLVCLGATLVMMTNQYVFQQYGVSDPVRMGAQVVSGIGFLGAGTIIITGRRQVKGITTAAGLWAAACGGLAIGIGFYEGAIVGGVATFLIITAMQKTDTALRRRSKEIELYLEYGKEHRLSDFIAFAREKGFEIEDIQLTTNRQQDKENVMAILSVKSAERLLHSEMVEILSQAPGVNYLEEL